MTMRGEQSIGTLSIREFIAIHMMAAYMKNAPTADNEVRAAASVAATDALLEELTKERQAE